MSVSTARDVFTTALPARLAAKPELVSQINAIYKFVVNGDGGGTWLVDLTQPGGVIRETDGEATCTVTVGADTLVDIVNGKAKAQMAFMMGKLKVAGDIKLAMKLGPLLG